MLSAIFDEFWKKEHKTLLSQLIFHEIPVFLSTITANSFLSYNGTVVKFVT